MPLVDELTRTFTVPKPPDVVRDELVKPSCIWPVCINCVCGFFVGLLLTALLCRRKERANSESTETGAAYIDPLLLASGGRSTSVTGPNESFSPAPTREQRQAWLEEGALHAEIEFERRANVSVHMVAPVSSVLLLHGDSGWLCVSSCSGDFVLSANPFEPLVL